MDRFRCKNQVAGRSGFQDACDEKGIHVERGIEHQGLAGLHDERFTAGVRLDAGEGGQEDRRGQDGEAGLGRVVS